jgi:hypothetical protein
MGTRWLGDLRTCFLLEGGWGFRQEVNRFLRAGRAGWRFPLAFAEFVGLGDGQDRELNVQGSKETLTLSRRRGHCSGGPIGHALSVLQAADGDLVLLQVQGSEARLRLRSTRERVQGTPLEELLWSCGLDPADESVQRDPWPKLGRALGGSAAGREEARHRLLVRGDDRLLSLLEASRVTTQSTGSKSDPSWHYTGALVGDGSSRVVVEGGYGRRRVLLGVLDASNQPPRGLVLTDGGLLWMEACRREASGVDDLLTAPPIGLIPSARKKGWCRWLRAEHVLRLCALHGVDWQIRKTNDGWHTSSGSVCDTLIDALEHAAPEVPDGGRPPAMLIRSAYPRSAGAFRVLSEEAVSRGLQALGADQDCGFRATYAGGDVLAASLHESLTCSA